MRSGPQTSATSMPKLLVVALLVLGIGGFIGQRSAVSVTESGESETIASGDLSDTVPTTGIAAASAKMPPPSLPGSAAQYYRSLAEGKPAAPEQESGQEGVVSQDPPVTDPVQSAGDTTEQEAVEQQDPPPTRRGARRWL